MASEWVATEIAKARKREVREGKRMLFPLNLAPFTQLRDWELFDSDTGKDSAREIREYFIPDFSQLEGPRLLPESIRPAAPRPASKRMKDDRAWLKERDRLKVGIGQRVLRSS